ncbi:hypothetical protein, partial [Klebsiella pneumoniae]|uniref:hypothetical protein n=1 Tax=Klebsiella pneumoniae TaxID=573 RepID=UPI00254AA696
NKLRTAVGAMYSVDPNTLTVSGNRVDGFKVTFPSLLFLNGLKGSLMLQGSNVVELSFNKTTTANFDIAEVLIHEAGISEQKVISFAGISGGTFELEIFGKRSGPIVYLADPTVQVQLIQK